MSDNGASCLCLTYGRPHLLEEAVESFLRQTWTGPKELIIVNDLPTQHITFNHPEVTVINLPRRMRSLGEKRNFSVSLATYNNLLLWDDDDIYLPWRIETTMKTLPSAHFFKCPNAWVMNDGKIDGEPQYNLFHGGSAFTRWLWEQVGGYKAMNGGEDAEIEGKFQKVGNGQHWPHTQLPKDQLYYIYRWNHGSFHTTGLSDLKNIQPTRNDPNWELKPQWRLPYESIASAAASVKTVAPMRKSSSPLNLICFSKNRPLQLDGYLRSADWSMSLKDSKLIDASVLYKCDPEYDIAYEQLKKKFDWINWLKQTNFHENLLSLFTDSKQIVFGCDDVVFVEKIDIAYVLRIMNQPNQFAFSFRLGRGLSRSMFGGKYSEPPWTENEGLLTWDLHASHAFGDYGYSWELDGTVYPSDIARQVVEELKSSSPNVLEATGGGKWSSKTKRSLISCFPKRALMVPTVNVVQNNFSNPVIGKEISPRFLLDAWNCGMRLDIDRYRAISNDCIHVEDFYLTNR